MWVPRRFGIVYTHEQQLCGLACACDSMCWKGRFLLRWQPIPLLTSSHQSFSSYCASFPHTATERTTLFIKRVCCSYELWKLREEYDWERFMLWLGHEIKSRDCRKCLKNKGDQLNVNCAWFWKALLIFQRCGNLKRFKVKKWILITKTCIFKTWMLNENETFKCL